jgi:hypothetical protein
MLREINVIGIDTKSIGIHWSSNFPIGPQGELYGWATCHSTHDDPRRQADLRRQQILLYAQSLAICCPEGTFVYCEEPLALQNGKTTRLLGLAAGAVWAAFHTHPVKVEWRWVDQSSWKKVVLGRGARPKDWDDGGPKSDREKRWIVETVRNNALFQQQADAIRTDDFDNQLDLYDAWAIRRYGVIQESF